VRIIPVKDVIEPRCKLEGKGECFPGFIGGSETVGNGATLVLKGAAVVEKEEYETALRDAAIDRTDVYEMADSVEGKAAECGHDARNERVRVLRRHLHGGAAA
jgi:hypothetical protein